MTVAITDSLDQSMCRSDIEPTTRPDDHSPDMDAGVLSAWHDRLDQIASAKAEEALLAWHMLLWEAELIRPAHLPRSVPFGGDQ